MTRFAAPFRTNSGILVDLSSPDPEVLDLDDIASHLSKIARFNGATSVPYSVASHSVYVARRLADDGYPRAVVAAGLLHDASEAYLGDMTSGLKRLFPDFRELERRWAFAVERRYDVTFVASKPIHNADLRARLAEARDLFQDYPRDQLVMLDATDGLQPYAERVVAESASDAEWAFLAMARELGLGVK